MAATSRWVRYPISASSYASAALAGLNGSSRGTSNSSDSFTIPGSSNNQLKVEIDNSGAPAPYQITLSSGTNLDPRFVARDIQRKIQAYGSVNNGYKYAQVEFDNYSSANGYGHFRILSGTTGATSEVNVTAGDSSVLTTLGMNTLSETVGSTYHRGTSTANSAYAGTVTVTGTYTGAFDDEYSVIISNSQLIGSVAYGGGNTFGVANAGVASVTGDWNFDSDNTYIVTVSTTNGSTMGGGTGNVPTFTVTMSLGSGDTVATAQELLFPEVWYNIGTRGLRMKFTDYPFGNGDTFTVACSAATTVDGSNPTGPVGTAKFVSRSKLGDTTAATLTNTTPANLGTKGLTIAWTSGTLEAKDQWRIFCRAPHPEAYGVTSMDYGNVTVTTNSPVKVHQFEIVSGATSMSSVKFSLQNKGTFQHHNAGDSDTFFRFGTVGAGHRGDGAGGAGTGPEWPASAVLATDISQNKTGGATGAPTMLYSSKLNLSVVSSADDAEVIGNTGLVSDYIFTCIKLGANEVGSNSSINMRLFFDYSS